MGKPVTAQRDTYPSHGMFYSTESALGNKGLVSAQTKWRMRGGRTGWPGVRQADHWRGAVAAFAVRMGRTRCS